MIKAGFSRVDVTPPLGLPISGYYRKRISKGILDPLEINAVAVSDGNDTVLILTVDFIGITMLRCNEIRAVISKRTGIDLSHIMVCALHQHTAIRITYFNYDQTMADFDAYRDETFFDVLMRKFGDVAQMACDDMKDAEVRTAVKLTSEPLSFIRRYIMKDGSLQTNPSNYDPSEIDRPNGEADNNVRLIRFVREGAKDIALVNFSTHPDTVGGEYFSADWPGFVRRFVEADLKDVSCILVNGAEGDSNHLDFIGGRRTGYEHTRHMGRVIADAVIEMWDDMTVRNAEGISGELRIISNKTNTSGADRYEEAKKFYDDYMSGNIDIRGHLADVAEAKRIICMRDQTMYRKVPLTVIRMGEIAFVGFGGEQFTEYAAMARAADTDSFVISTCCTNGYEGYLPTKSAFDEGGYEARSSNFTPELEKQLVDAFTEMLNLKK